MSKIPAIIASGIGAAVLWFLFSRTHEEQALPEPANPITGMDYALAVLRFGFAIDLDFNKTGSISFLYPGTSNYNVHVRPLYSGDVHEFVVSVGNGGRLKTRQRKIGKDQLISICSIVDELADALHVAARNSDMLPSKKRFQDVKTEGTDYSKGFHYSYIVR